MVFTEAPSSSKTLGATEYVAPLAQSRRIDRPLRSRSVKEDLQNSTYLP